MRTTIFECKIADVPNKVYVKKVKQYAKNNKVAGPDQIPRALVIQQHSSTKYTKAASYRKID